MDPATASTAPAGPPGDRHCGRLVGDRHLAEVVSLAGRLDLALDGLANALDPAPCGR
jgi:hypothetical protein